MHATGIIAEYNPLHNGHLYHLTETRRLTDADYIIAVISGDFVQRGAPALLDKYTRARMALLAGADLVLELPVGFGCASAEYFASGAVGLLDSLGVVDTLSFGSECGETEPLTKIAALLQEEPQPFRILLKRFLKSGLSFPAARKEALLSYIKEHPEDTRIIPGFLDSPNNILGIEYCKALLRRSSSIRAFTVQRQGTGYHSASLETELGSASAIRSLLQKRPLGDCISDLERQLPLEVLRLLVSALAENNSVWMDDFSLLLKYRLLQETPETLTSYMDVSPELANRIYARLNDFSDISSFAELLKTRELTHTRILRALLHILLDIRNIYPVSYGRVLGFRKEAQPLLSAIKKKGQIPLLTKLADADKLLDSDGVQALRQDTFAANLYESAAAQNRKKPFRHEFTRQIEII